LKGEEQAMRRVIGMDIHRTFAEVVFWEEGKLRPAGRITMTRAGLEGFGRSLGKEDEVVIEATGNAMAVVRVLAPYVARVIVANPLQVKAIAHAHVKTDKIDAGVLASLRAANFLPEIWLPDADTERLRRLVARRGCPAPHADQERGALDPACPSDPAVPACRHVRATGPDLAGTTDRPR
jgi:transposase